MIDSNSCHMYCRRVWFADRSTGNNCTYIYAEHNRFLNSNVMWTNIMFLASKIFN